MVGEWKDLPVEVKESCAKVCRSCADQLKKKSAQTGPWLLDKDGVNVAVSGKRGKWRHAWDDGWWPCKAAKILDRAGEVRFTSGKGATE